MIKTIITTIYYNLRREGRGERGRGGRGTRRADHGEKRDEKIWSGAQKRIF